MYVCLFDSMVTIDFMSIKKSTGMSLKAILFSFSGKQVMKWNEGIETEFQFSEVLLKPGLAMRQQKLYSAQFKRNKLLDNISCYSSKNYVPI